MSANATKLKLEMSTVSVPETAHYVERTPLELAVLKAGKKQYDGCDHCPCCLMLLKVSLGRHPVTSLYSATTRDEELQTLVQETLKFQISSDPMHVDLSKRSLCRFHALHYKLYVHRFNIDTMIAIKTFDHEDMVLDDATMEQVLSNLPSVEKAWEKSYGQWVRDLQAHVLELFAENVEKSFLCLKADLHQKLFAKEKQLEKRISQIQEEQDLALDEAEGRLQIQMQSEKFKRAKHQLDDYGRVYRNASSTGQPHLFQLMKTYADSERKDGERFDDDLRVAYLRKVDKAKELQDKELLVWKGKLDNHRKQQYVTVRDTTAKFHLGKQNRLQRLRDVQASEAKKVFDDFRRHMVHMRSLALRRGVNVQTTTLRPITPTICGYMLLVLKRALPTSLQPKTIMKDGVPLHDSKAGTVLAQFAAWIHESVELGHLSGRELFTLIDTRRAGRVTSTDLQQFVVRHNILLHPSILFNTVPKETPGVICMDDFLMAMRPLELEYEIAEAKLLIRRADAYHKVAITAVFGKQNQRSLPRKAGSALSRSPSPGARSSRDGGSPKTARSLGHVAGAQTTSVRAGTLTPHKPMFALELHSKPNFAGVNNLGKVNQKATSFLWDPVSKTRQELAANKTASSPMMSKTVADSLRRFALDPKSQPTRLGSPKHELATKRPTSTLVRSGSTVETYAADTKGGITAELLDTDHDFGSAQEEIFKTSNGGSKSPGGGANKALKDFQQKNGELSRRHDRRSMTRNRRLSRERKSENTQKAVKRYHGQQDEAHSTASGSRPQSMVDTNSPPGSPASSFSGLRASVAQFETSVGKMGGVRGTSANAAKKRASLLHRAATLIGGVRFDDDVSHSQQPTSGGASATAVPRQCSEIND
eukprot:g25.t1